MNGHSPLFEAFVYLVAAVVTVPVAKRLGSGSVLGYLIAGAAARPGGARARGRAGGEDVLHFAEFGVVMMLFVVGLELEPALLWRLRAPILGLGGLQVVGTTAWSPRRGGARPRVAGGARVGMTLALSSTAIVLQTLAEKGLLKSAGGQSAFSVLPVPGHRGDPDARRVPAAAAARGGTARAGREASTWDVRGSPAVGADARRARRGGGVVLAGRFVVRPLFLASRAPGPARDLHGGGARARGRDRRCS
jgi:hypothetical protein